MYNKITPEIFEKVLNELKEKHQDNNEYVFYIAGDFDTMVEKLKEFDRLIREEINNLNK